VVACGSGERELHYSTVQTVLTIVVL
jgi:hypothetical protein